MLVVELLFFDRATFPTSSCNYTQNFLLSGNFIKLILCRIVHSEQTMASAY